MTATNSMVPRQGARHRRTCLPVLLLAATACWLQRSNAFMFPSARSSRTLLVPYAPRPMRSAPPRIAEADGVVLPATEEKQNDSRPSSHGTISTAAPTRSSLSRRLRFSSRRSRSGEPTGDGGVQMTFQATKSVRTPPAPLPPTTRGGGSSSISSSQKKTLNDFFARDEFRNLLFFRNAVTAVPDPTREQLDKWASELRLGGGCELDNGGEASPTQRVIQIRTHLTMPGLKILTVNTIGAKLLLADDDSRRPYPEYQFTLIDSDLRPEGAAPLVWLFNRLIRFRDATSSFTRVRAIDAGGRGISSDDDHQGEEVVFTTEARLETRIRLSRSALRAIPAVNVQKFERQGSRSLQRLLEKELEPALMGFRDAYLKWIKT